MKKTKVPDPIAKVLYTYCDVNAFTPDWRQSLRGELNRPGSAETRCLFQRQLADAILNRTISPSDYEKLTGEDFDSEDALVEWLRTLWDTVFENEPVKVN